MAEVAATAAEAAAEAAAAVEAAAEAEAAAAAAVAAVAAEAAADAAAAKTAAAAAAAAGLQRKVQMRLLDAQAVEDLERDANTVKVGMCGSRGSQHSSGWPRGRAGGMPPTHGSCHMQHNKRL